MTESMLWHKATLPSGCIFMVFLLLNAGDPGGDGTAAPTKVLTRFKLKVSTVNQVNAHCHCTPRRPHYN